MNRRIARLIQIGLFAALPAGAAFAQSTAAPGTVANTGGITERVGGQGADSAKGLAGTLPDTTDTRTPAQEKANRIDEQTPVVPSDAMRPGELPARPQSDRGDTTGSTTPGSGSTDGDMHKALPPTTGEESTTVEKKTVKHKHMKKSSSSTTSATPAIEPDDSMSHKQDSKGDLGNKDLLNSDK